MSEISCCRVMFYNLVLESVFQKKEKEKRKTFLEVRGQLLRAMHGGVVPSCFQLEHVVLTLGLPH